MILNEIPQRCDVAKEYTWSLEEIYSDISVWNKDLQRLEQKQFWLEEKEYQNKMQDPVEVKFVLDFLFSFTRALEKLYVYAQLRSHEDLSNAENKAIFLKARGLYFDFEKAHSWIRPALLHLSDADFTKLIQDKKLQVYARFLEKIGRMRQHTLSAEQESLLALAQKPLSVAKTAFTALHNADFQFSPVTDGNGETHAMNRSAYGKYLRSSDRVLRKAAYESFFEEYAKHENTIVALLEGSVAKDVYEAKARNYTSSLEASLYPNNIDRKVYDNLIETVEENLDSLHRYVALRKRILGLEKLHSYDLGVPLVQEEESCWSYERAKQVVVDSVAILGEEYQTALKKGVYEENWVDIHPNQKKRSGAYSIGAYDCSPYILLNYPYTSASLRDVFTLAHELGHSMHAYHSRAKQSYIDFHYPIFVAEVASTFNEQLLLEHLMKNATSAKQKAYLLTYAIESIRGTFFYQTMFAHFERKLHAYAENNTPITPQLLRKEYGLLKQKYYGNDLTMDPLAEIGYLAIPHFYSNFYVYQYATGIAAAFALCEQVQKNPLAKERYLTFLRSGGSRFPLDLLQTAGVDMREKAPIEATIRRFADLVDQLEKLVATEELTQVTREL